MKTSFFKRSPSDKYIRERRYSVLNEIAQLQTYVPLFQFQAKMAKDFIKVIEDGVGSKKDKDDRFKMRPTFTPYVRGLSDPMYSLIEKHSDFCEVLRASTNPFTRQQSRSTSDGNLTNNALISMGLERTQNPSRICWKDDLYNPSLVVLGMEPCRRLKAHRLFEQGLRIYLQNRIIRKRLKKAETYNARIPNMIWTVSPERIWELRLGLHGSVLGFASWDDPEEIFALTSRMKDTEALFAAQGLTDATYFDPSRFLEYPAQLIQTTAGSWVASSFSK